MQGAPLTPTEKFLGREVGGFDFSLTSRNDRLVQTMGPGAGGARFHKTGTTICGVVFAGGVVLGADTRATEGDTVSGGLPALGPCVLPNTLRAHFPHFPQCAFFFSATPSSRAPSLLTRPYPLLPPPTPFSLPSPPGVRQGL